MTTPTAASPTEHRRPRLTTVLEVAMVVAGPAIGAAFFTSIWSERASSQLDAAFGPTSASRSS